MNEKRGARFYSRKHHSRVAKNVRSFRYHDARKEREEDHRGRLRRRPHVGAKRGISGTTATRTRTAATKNTHQQNVHVL